MVAFDLLAVILIIIAGSAWRNHRRVSAGVGLGVMSGGRLLTGHGGLAGEIGHITVEMDGRRCGCGMWC